MPKFKITKELSYNGKIHSIGDIVEISHDNVRYYNLIDSIESYEDTVVKPEQPLYKSFNKD